jgi:MFS family permease
MFFSKKKEDDAKRISIIALSSYFGLALVGTIWAIYLESILHNPSLVGFLSTFFGIIELIALILIIPLIEKNSKTKLWGISIILYVASYVLFYFFSNLYAVIILGIILSFATALRWNSFGIILSDKSKSNSLSKNIGFSYSLFNFAWLIGPIIAGFFSERLGIENIFLIGAGFMLFSFLLLRTFGIKDNRKQKKADNNFLKIIKSYFKNKNLRKIYFISGGISFWWAFIFTYIPIMIIESGKSPVIVGYFLSAVILPLVLFEFQFGKIAGKKGAKKMFFIGYLLLFAIPLICFFLNNLYIILILLALGSIGVAMLEPTTEAYFFDIIKKKQKDKYYGVYNTTMDVHYALSLFAVALLIYFLPFKYSFLIISLGMGVFTLLSLRIKNVVESRRKS